MHYTSRRIFRVSLPSATQYSRSFRAKSRLEVKANENSVIKKLYQYIFFKLPAQVVNARSDNNVTSCKRTCPLRLPRGKENVDMIKEFLLDQSSILGGSLENLRQPLMYFFPSMQFHSEDSSAESFRAHK